MFLETSALTGENVEEGFLKCARTILNKIDSGTLISFAKQVECLCESCTSSYDLHALWTCSRSESVYVTFLTPHCISFQRRVRPREDGFRYPVWRRIVETAAAAKRHHHTE